MIWQNTCIVVWLIVPEPSLSKPSKPFFKESIWGMKLQQSDLGHMKLELGHGYKLSVCAAFNNLEKDCMKKLSWYLFVIKLSCKYWNWVQDGTCSWSSPVFSAISSHSGLGSPSPISLVQALKLNTLINSVACLVFFLSGLSLSLSIGWSHSSSLMSPHSAQMSQRSWL